MSILEKLKADHGSLKALLDAVIASADGQERKRLFKQFTTEITAHNKAEENIFYKNLVSGSESHRLITHAPGVVIGV